MYPNLCSNLNEPTSAMLLNRNALLERLDRLPRRIAYAVLLDERFQRALNKLDPDLPNHAQSIDAMYETYEAGLMVIGDIVTAPSK